VLEGIKKEKLQGHVPNPYSLLAFLGNEALHPIISDPLGTFLKLLRTLSLDP
jgi:hypothetical protein